MGDANLRLLPPPASACQICARDPAHDPGEPHDATSLYYKMHFFMENQRWPTWEDAMSHCDEETRRLWTEELKKMGQIK